MQTNDGGQFIVAATVLIRPSALFYKPLMTLNDTTFAALSELTLNRLADTLEAEDAEGLLEVELASGTLNITCPGGQQFVVNRHAPSRQMWLSSPLSGGLHFDYDEEAKAWTLKDGRRLDTLLKAEIETLAGEEDVD